MKRRYLLTLVGIALILSAFLVLPVLAEDAEVSRATLAGLQGVSAVEVNELPAILGRPLLYVNVNT